MIGSFDSGDSHFDGSVGAERIGCAGMPAAGFTKKLPASSFEDPGRLASRSVRC
jgi:hypothetical protein